MKRGIMFIFSVIVVASLLFPLISANPLTSLWNQITGKATSGSASLNITVGNHAPTIPYVEALSAQSPTEDGITTVKINFTVNDLDGYENINTSAARIYFQKSGQTTRSNTSCVSYQSGGDEVNFTCTVEMYYFDGSGSWTINATAADINNAHGANSSTSFTYNLLTAMKMSPAALGWPAISITSTNVGSSENPITVNNTGNANGLGINVTGYNLQGETNPSYDIYADNFSIGTTSPGCSGGTTMANATSLTVASATLNNGNHSINDGSTGQEQIYFCLKGVPPTITSQSYSSAAYGPWSVEVV